MAVNLGEYLSDCPWFNYSALLLAQFVIYLAVSSWLSPQSNQFVFIEHLLCLEGLVCSGVRSAGTGGVMRELPAVSTEGSP